MGLPEEEYWRTNTPINKDIPFKEAMEIIKEENKILLEMEMEEQDKY